MLYRVYARLYLWGLTLFNNSTDEPKEHHNHLILNNNSNVYITSLLNLIDEIFTPLLE